MMKRSVPGPVDVPSGTLGGNPKVVPSGFSGRRSAASGAGGILTWLLGCIAVVGVCLYCIWGPAVPSPSPLDSGAPFSWRLDEARRAAHAANRKSVFVPLGSAEQSSRIEPDKGRVPMGGLISSSMILSSRSRKNGTDGGAVEHLQQQQRRAMALVCTAHAPSKDQPGLSDFSFYQRFQHNPPRTNLGILTREARFHPELSPSPLIQSYFVPTDGAEPRGGSALTQEAAAEWISRTLSDSPCTSSPFNHSSNPGRRRGRPLIVLTTCRDQPKRAWEHVAYHALLGVTRVLMLDVASGTRPSLPSLRQYLAPWLVSEGVGGADGAKNSGAHIVELVSGAAYLATHRDATTSGAPTAVEDASDDVGMDAEDAAIAQDLFFRTAPQEVYLQHPDAVVLLLEDVNDFLLITAAPATTKRFDAAATSAHEGVLPEPLAVPPSPLEEPSSASFLCIADVYQAQRNDPHLVSLPKITVGASALFDNARTPFERVHFASGDSSVLMEGAARFVRRAVGTGAAATVHGSSAAGDASRHLLQAFGVLGAVRSIAQHEAFAAHGRLPAERTRFPGGTSWHDLQKRGQDATAPLSSVFGQQLDTATFTARVVRVANSLQSEVETAVDACYRTASKGTTTTTRRGGGGGSNVFDVARLRSPLGSNIDDLPTSNSLRRNGFLALHALLLQLMQYPTKGRRERTFPQVGVSSMPQIQKLLAPYAVYGNVDVSLTGGVAPSAPGFDITNENLVSGAVRLLPERPLIDGLNTTHLDAVLRNMFHGQRACPSLRPPPLSLSQNPRNNNLADQGSSGGVRSDSSNDGGLLNVTFCTVVRNRAKLTLEWILYHKLLGVGRFIVVDDASTDGLVALLAPLVARGVVVVLNADDGSNVYRFRSRVVKGPLLAGYGMCVDQELARAVHQGHERAPWLGFLDSDEFLMLPTGECVPELVSRVVREHSTQHRRIGALAFSWRTVPPLNNDLFDTSPTQFHRTAFSRGVADRIQRIKVIADASLAEAMDTAHKVELLHGAQTIFPNGKVVTGPGWFTGATDATEAQGTILHYHARSLVSWMQRYLDGFADNNDHQWPFDLNTYFGRWFADTAKTVSKADRAWMEAIPGWKERVAVVEALMTGHGLPGFV